MPGTLYVVATPIGNLGDLSSARPRGAGERRIDRGGGYAPHPPVAAKLRHRHGADVAARTQRGAEERGAHCTTCTRRVDRAGVATRARRWSAIRASIWSRPRAAQGIAVVAIPGRARRLQRCRSRACRPIASFSKAFCPRKARARRAHSQQLAREARTLIFYEAPHRLADVLRDMARTFGAERRASISRELTKRFETTYSGTLAELAKALSTTATCRAARS